MSVADNNCKRLLNKGLFYFWKDGNSWIMNFPTNNNNLSYIFVMHFTQNLHFSESPDAGEQRLKDTGDLLQCSTAFVPRIYNRPLGGRGGKGGVKNHNTKNLLLIDSPHHSKRAIANGVFWVHCGCSNGAGEGRGPRRAVLIRRQGRILQRQRRGETRRGRGAGQWRVLEEAGGRRGGGGGGGRGGKRGGG